MSITNDLPLNLNVPDGQDDGSGTPRRSLSQSLLNQIGSPVFGTRSASPLFNASVRRTPSVTSRGGSGYQSPSLQSLVKSFINKVSRGTQTDCDDNFDQISIASLASGFSTAATDLTRSRLKLFLNDRTIGSSVSTADDSEFVEELQKLRDEIDGRFFGKLASGEVPFDLDDNVDNVSEKRSTYEAQFGHVPITCEVGVETERVELHESTTQTDVVENKPSVLVNSSDKSEVVKKDLTDASTLTENETETVKVNGDVPVANGQVPITTDSSPNHEPEGEETSSSSTKKNAESSSFRIPFISGLLGGWSQDESSSQSTVLEVKPSPERAEVETQTELSHSPLCTQCRKPNDSLAPSDPEDSIRIVCDQSSDNQPIIKCEFLISHADLQMKKDTGSGFNFSHIPKQSASTQVTTTTATNHVASSPEVKEQKIEAKSNKTEVNSAAPISSRVDEVDVKKKVWANLLAQRQAELNGMATPTNGSPASQNGNRNKKSPAKKKAKKGVAIVPGAGDGTDPETVLVMKETTPKCCSIS